MNRHIRRATICFTLLLVLILVVGLNNIFKGFGNVAKAAAIKHKPSHISNKTKPKPTQSSSLSSQHGSTLDPSTLTGCINYNPATRSITVNCTGPTRLTDVNNALHDPSVLAKQTPAGEWLLSANLVIGKEASFHIDASDTKWLKIDSKVIGSSNDRSGGVSSSSGSFRPAYWIDIHGSLRVDSVKITSWDPTTNYYAKTNGSRTGIGQFIIGAPRPSIVIEKDATGPTNIMNSEIAYLGFEGGKHLGDSGLVYSGGDGSILKNDNIHHLDFGFYSIGVGHMIIENNIIRNSGHYGLDPHTGTHDMIILNNTIYNNNGSGIICSLNCYNILIENNRVHNNAENGIDFSRNMTNSVARNNIVQNEPSGIFVSQSHNNQIYSNFVYNSGSGINVNTGSSNNKIFGNTVSNSLTNALLLASGASGNTFTSNRISSITPAGLKIEQDPTSKNNILSNNQIIHHTK